MYKGFLRKIGYLFIFFSPVILNASPIFQKEFFNIQGGIYLHEINEKEYFDGYTLNGKNLLTIKKNDRFYLIYGIPYGISPGVKEIIISNVNSKKSLKLTINKTKFGRQDITVSKTYTKPSEKNIERIIKEKNIISKYRNTWSKRDPDIEFIYPVKGRVTGVFGTERYYNGEKGRYHNGIDIAASINTAIVAPSSGKVILTGDFFYNGKFVYIDHGKGLLSVFIHLNEINTSQGKFVKKGELIGKIGSTGRSTGPHVHWSVILNQNYVNPMVFLTNN
ncbi:MAG: M23 family metallopeptidase [Pseudomonadota bacterium]|nr:M23 family metallopeptidase [Pseudomonadota bacterium]